MNADHFLGIDLPTLGFGGIAGLAVGYTAKKVTKLAALLLGITFVVVQALAYLGLIQVNWGEVERFATTVNTTADGGTLAGKAWEIVTANLPFGGGFVAGFAVGLKLG